MRLGTKAMIRACLAGSAIAAVIVTGAGTASAQTTSPAAHAVSAQAHLPLFCNPFQKERWNLNGFNTVDVTYKLVSHYYYTVDLVQHGSCLSGWLDDPYFPVTRPVYGSVYGNLVTFSFTYPSFIEGTRTYTGVISPSGFVFGGWAQTGIASPDFGTFVLSGTAAPACPSWVWWTHYCTVP